MNTITGLKSSEVLKMRKAGKCNKQEKNSSKSYGKILFPPLNPLYKMVIRKIVFSSVYEIKLSLFGSREGKREIILNEKKLQLLTISHNG